MDEEKVRYFIEAERKKGTSTEELIFILYDNGVPVYEISNFLDVSIRHVEEVLRLSVQSVQNQRKLKALNSLSRQ